MVDFNHYFIVGDSIAYGFGVKDERIKDNFIVYNGKFLFIPEQLEQGWANYLCNNIKNIDDPQKVFFAYNLSTSGSTSSSVLPYINEEIGRRALLSKRKVVLLALGINDSRYYIDNNEKRFHVKKSVFKSNLERIIDDIFSMSSSNTQVFVLGLTKVDEERTKPFIFKNQKPLFYYDNKTIREYDAIIRKVVSEYQKKYSKETLSFIEIFNKFPSSNYLFSDGLHPNKLGHAIIYYLVTKELLGDNTSLSSEGFLLKESDFDYDSRKTTRVLPEYVRESFVSVASMLLANLKDSRMRISLIPNIDYDYREKRVLEQANPWWYRKLFRENKHWNRGRTINALLRIINGSDGNYGVRRFKYDFKLRELITEILTFGYRTDDGIRVPEENNFCLFMYPEETKNIDEDPDILF